MCLLTIWLRRTLFPLHWLYCTLLCSSIKLWLFPYCSFKLKLLPVFLTLSCIYIYWNNWLYNVQNIIIYHVIIKNQQDYNTDSLFSGTTPGVCYVTLCKTIWCNTTTTVFCPLDVTVYTYIGWTTPDVPQWRICSFLFYNRELQETVSAHKQQQAAALNSFG